MPSKLFAVVFASIAAFCGLLSKAESASMFPKKLNLDPPQHLLIGLDGIGYDIFLEMYRGGHFQDFKRPARMVASFPSISDPNWSRIMGTDVEESYTKVHFDAEAETDDGVGKPVGNILTNLKTNLHYLKAFDFRPENAFEQLTIMGWTETTGKYAVDSMIEFFLRAKGKEAFYKAFILNPDIISHMGGKKAVLKFLKYLDERVSRLRQEYKKEFGKTLEITMVSDHGNSFVNPLFVDYLPALESNGWKVVESLSEKIDVAIVVPEILSFAAFYTLPGPERKLANDLSKIKGIEFSAFSNSRNHLGVFVGGEELNFEFKEDRFRLKSTTNPKSIWSTKFRSGSWQDFREYFRDTSKNDYPYWVVRLWEGFYVNSHQKASVLVSTAPRFAFANPTLNMISKIKGQVKSLHGSLHALQTNGIYVSTKKEADDVRPQDFKNQVKF